MIRRVVVVALMTIAACNGELRFEDPIDTPEGGIPPGVPPPVPPGGEGGPPIDGAPTKHCATDPDCVLPTLHCDAVAGACVPCTLDDHCKANEDAKRCDTAVHRCIECGNDGDCGGGGKICQPDTHRCVTTCASIAQCITAEAPLCDTAKGFCVRCTGPGSTCTFTPETPICDPGGYCVECLRDTDCSAKSPRCDPSLRKCVQCTSGADCPGAAQCDPSNGTCVGG